jgi:hypothetical protein
MPLPALSRAVEGELARICERHGIQELARRPTFCRTTS